jgi:hypothetical protein
MLESNVREHDGAGYSHLIEENVFPIICPRGVIFEVPFSTDSVFPAKLFPKLSSNLIPALSDLKAHDLARHFEILFCWAETKDQAVPLCCFAASELNEGAS